MAKVEEKSWKPEDVAVIGLACRFPGSASNEAKLWELLEKRESAHSKVPEERYNIDAFHQQGATHSNNLAADGGHYLEQDVKSFDAPFFNITTKEAKAMDPQARMLLECSYEALENAGLSLESIRESDTGCYVGCFNRDYHELLVADAENSPEYSITGTGFSLFANRLSWYYDLKGPSKSEDTACSSSLVALDSAYKSLLRGESKMAMVCGTNLMLSPNIGIWLSKLGMLSSEGLSRSFAEGVSGYGRGEGIAAVILKPLADALRDGDTIRAVINGTGVNQDGHTKGITVPDSQAQSELIESTYRTAGLDFADTGYFEAHGTGTAVGDPLEIEAVKRVIENSKRTSPLYVGSIKSNIGHLEGAAGLAGLIKCILMLEKGVILPNIQFERPNEKISFEQIVVPTTVMPWPEGVKRRASVNSFGYGGTNAHVIVEAFVAPCPQSRDDDLQSLPDDGLVRPSSQQLFVLTGREQSTVQEMRLKYASYVQRMLDTASPGVAFDDLSYTLGQRRSKLDWAVAHVASDFGELQRKLSTPEVAATRSSNKARVGFVFTGQGAQWPRMGLELMRYTTFRVSIQEADKYLTQHLDCPWSVMDELAKYEGESRIRSSELGQPLCTIVQVAMVDLLEGWNVRPTAVVGHSSGEIAAAYCTGAISKQAAWQIAFHRGRECANLKTEAPELQGAMLAVGLNAESIGPYINDFQPGHINVACVNSPKSITVSGDAPEIRKLQAMLTADNIFARELPVENAYHSHHMELVAQSYLHSISDVNAPKSDAVSGMTMLSSVTGRLMEPSELTPEYWVRNLVSPVLFADAVTAMLRGSKRSFRRSTRAEPAIDFLLEIGPHATLQTPLLDIVKAEAQEDVEYASVLLRGKSAIDSAMTTAGSLYCHGCPVNVAAVNETKHECRVLVDLPAYPWNRSHRYWGVSRLMQGYLHRAHGHHSLLGARLIGSDALNPAWRHFLNFDDNPWIKEHVVHGATLFPGAGFLVMAIEAALQLAEPGRKVANVRLENVRVVKALILKEGDSEQEVITRFRQGDIIFDGASSGRWEFEISSAKGMDEHEQRVTGQDEFERHATGRITLDYQPERPFLSPLSDLVHEARKGEYAKLADACVDTMSQDEFYEASKDAGLDYGPDFQGIDTLARGTGSCCWSVQITERSTSLAGGSESKHLMHPATLDAIVHSLFGAMNGGKKFQSAALPVAFDSITISSQTPNNVGASLAGFTVIREAKEREIVADIHVSSGEWTQPLVQITGLRCTEMPSQQGELHSPVVRPSPVGTITYRPDIGLFDEESLMSYINDKQKPESPAKSHSVLYSERLRDAVAQVVELASFKNPGLSVLQMGGHDHGITDSLLFNLKVGSAGQALSAKIVILDPSQEAIVQIRGKYDGESSIVDALHFDGMKPLPSEVRQKDGYDVVVVTIDHCLDNTSKQDLLTEAQSVLKEGGIFVVFDTLRAIKEHPFIHGFSRVAEPPSGQIRTWASFTIKDPACEHAAVVSTQEGDLETARHTRPVCILRPANCTERVKDVVGILQELLRSHDIEVTVYSWPLSAEDARNKCVISLLDLEQPFLCKLDAPDFDAIRRVALRATRLVWVSPSDDPHTAVATGWLRVLQSENTNRQYQHLTLEETTERSPFDLALAIAKVAMVQTDEGEFFEQDGSFKIPRWSYDPEMTRTIVDSAVSLESDSVRLGDLASGPPLQMLHAGDCNHAHLVPDTDQPLHLAAGNVEVELSFVNITDQDSVSPGMRALREASGVVKAVCSDVSPFRPGDKVCLSFIGHLSTRVIVDEAFCQKVPPGVEMAEAACVPITLATTLRALVDVAGVKPQHNVLVQAGGTRIGRAAILIASASGAVVFATARNAEEVESLIALGMSTKNILLEGDPLLPTATKILTDNRGWDIIVRTAKTAFETCILPNCIADFGAVVDVFPSSSTECVQETAISVMGIGSLLPEDPILMQKTVSRVAEYLPQLSTLANSFDVFPSSAIPAALEQHKVQGELRGVIVSFDQEDIVQVSPSAKNTMQLHHDATYVMAGGLGGLGRSLAKLLVENGARNLVFLSRSGPSTTAAKALMRSITGLGATVKTLKCDIGDENSVAAALDECSSMPPIRGVIHAAADIQDNIYDNYKFEQWQANLRPKVQGSWNLHRQLPEDMDFFVMLSSIAGLIGHRGQAGYAAGNTFQDSLALYRHSRGLPAVTIDLGPMLDVGTITEGTTAADFSLSDAAWMKAVDLHNVMKMCISNEIDGYAIPAQVITGLPSGGMLQVEQQKMPLYFSRPLFAFLKHLGRSAVSAVSMATPVERVMDFAAQLTTVGSMDEADCLTAGVLRAHLAKAVQRAVGDVDLSQPLYTYGIDSLMAVELRAWVGKEMKADVTLFDILNAKSIQALASKISKASQLVPQKVRGIE